MTLKDSMTMKIMSLQQYSLTRRDTRSAELMVRSQHGELETKIDRPIMLACKTQFFTNLLLLIKECFEVKQETVYDPRFLYIYFGSLFGSIGPFQSTLIYCGPQCSSIQFIWSILVHFSIQDPIQVWVECMVLNTETVK